MGRKITLSKAATTQNNELFGAHLQDSKAGPDRKDRRQSRPARQAVFLQTKFVLVRRVC